VTKIVCDYVSWGSGGSLKVSGLGDGGTRILSRFASAAAFDDNASGFGRSWGHERPISWDKG
jgi:hypothetical protein